MIYSLYTLIGVLIFAPIMYVVAKVFKLGDFSDKEKKAPKKKATDKKSFLETYCDDKKDDNYKARAKWILIHDKEERAKRGQLDSD